MNATYRFGPYVYEGAAHRLLRDGSPVWLTPKQLELLAFFLRRAGEVVTKDALFEGVWPATRVSEDAISQAVSHLRESLGDSAEAPTLIETVARRGYRFMAPVIRLAAPQPRDAHVSDAPGTRKHVEAAPGIGQRLAVLDFVNSTSEPEGEWLPSAIARSLTAGLRAVAGFCVVDRQHVADAVAAFGPAPEAVASHVRADVVVVGTIQRSRTRIRLSGRLLDMRENEALVEARVEGTTEELFTLLDQMVVVFAHGLGVRLPTGEGRSGTHETRSLEAYRAAADGWRHLETRDIRALPDAADAFGRALAADCAYAIAHAGLAHARLARFESTRADNQPDVDALEEAVAHAREATSLDDGLAETHAILGVALAGRDNALAAVAELDRAVALEPGNWRHHVRLGHVTWGARRMDAADRALALYPSCVRARFHQATVLVARRETERARHVLEEGLSGKPVADRVPVPGLAWLLGLIHLSRGHGAAATAAFEQELAVVDPKHPFGREYAMHAHLGYGLVLLTSRRAFDALSEFGAALALYPDHGASNLATASALVGLGDRARASRHLAAADDAIAVLEQHRPWEAQYVRAQRLSVTGNPDGALEVLQRLLGDAPPGSTGWTIPIDPLLGGIRTRPGYSALLEALAARAE